MRKEDFNNALNYIDYDLVEEYVAQKEQMQKRTVQRRAFVRFVPIAACFVLIITFSVTLLPMILNDQFEYSKDDVPSGQENITLPPTTSGTDDAETSPESPEAIGPEQGGNAEPIPGGDGGQQKPNTGEETPSSPAGPMFYYNFMYQDRMYEVCFISQDLESFMSERNERSLKTDDVGEYIDTVSVYCGYDGSEITCPIYQGTDDNRIIVELFDGYYYIAE